MTSAAMLSHGLSNKSYSLVDSTTSWTSLLGLRNFKSQPAFLAEAHTLTNEPMPTLSIQSTFAKSTRIGLPSGISSRKVVESLGQVSITTLPVHQATVS